MRRHFTVGTLSLMLFVALLATAEAQSALPPHAPNGSSADPAEKEPKQTDAVKQQEPQLPDTPSAVTPLTSHQKFETFVKRTYSPYTFVSAAYGATWAQAMGDWPTYGGGMQGWGKRFGATMANTEGRMFFNSFLFPVVFHQDPRYFSSAKQGFFPRAWYAATRVAVGRGDAGNSMFNYSEFLSVLVMSSVQNSYYPQRDRGLDETLNRFAGGLGSDATGALLKEFSPDLKRFARKIVPKRAQTMEQKMEQKIPEPVRKMTTPPAP